MKAGMVFGAIVAAIAIAFGVYMIDIDQTQETRLPEVSIDGGQLPEFDADVGSISVTEEQVTVTVPELNITPPEDDDNIATN